MKTYLVIFFALLSLDSYSQNSEELYVPIEIAYYPGYHFRIPWEEEQDKYTWFKVLTYSLTNPKDSRKLYSTNKAEFNKKNNKMLFTRNGCDSLIREYTRKASTMVENRNQFGVGAYYEQEKSGDKLYWRCVCMPASEIKDLPHGDDVVVGVHLKYLEPKDFVYKFKKYKLDSLDLNDAPYFTIFPTDISPSFDCSKASTVIEKAICRNAELANLDKELFKLYKEAFKAKGNNVKSDQRKWLTERDKNCEGKKNENVTEILKELYNIRINELKKIINSTDAHL